MRKLLLCLLTGLVAGPLFAQDESVLRAAMYLSGASSEEEIPTDWIERLEDVRIIQINSPHLRPGVLLTAYQVACIQDYRATSGDILSYGELALVDGFSLECVEALKPFLSLYSDRMPGQADTARVDATALVRTTLKTVGAKAKVSGSHWRAGGAWRGEDGTAYAEGTWRRNRVLAGDFQTRWGQGLAAWTGFTMESLSTVDAFIKRSTGLSPVWSYSSESVHRGVAYEYAGIHMGATAFAGLGEDFGAHADYLWRNGQVGVTALFTKGNFTGSLDGKYSLRGTDFVGEIAWSNRSVAGKIAVRGKMGEACKWTLQGRWIPSRFSGKKNGEYGMAAGFTYRQRDRLFLSLTADAALLPIPGTDPRRFQLRIYGIAQWTLSPAWLLDLRLTERFRNYEAPRTDFRADVKFTSGPWLSVIRAEGNYCGGWGFLTYLEGGYKTEKSALYIRLTGFYIDQWAARIYCYERDAAGTFSVPAYNGRGCVASLVGSCKLRLGRRLILKAHLRAGCQFKAGQKPAPTLNLQLQGDDSIFCRKCG